MAEYYFIGVYLYVPPFLFPVILHRHLVCFHVLALMNNAAMNIISLRSRFHFFGYILQNRMARPLVVLILNFFFFEEQPYSFPWCCTNQSVFPVTVYKGLLSSLSLWKVVFFYFFFFFLRLSLDRFIHSYPESPSLKWILKGHLLVITLQ